MREININRQLLGIEDLLFGFGKVTQTRAGQSVDITKINVGNLPFDETQTLLEWTQNVNLAELGAMTVELQAIYNSIDALNNLEDNLVALNILAQAINCLNNLCSNLTKLQNIDTNMTKLQNIDTNMTKLQNIDTNMTKLQNIDTNMLQLSSIYTNMVSLQNIYTNMSSLNAINSQIIPHLSEILLVDDYAGQVASDKTSVAAMKLAIETIYDTFDDRFLGTKTSDPTLDNEGNPLIDGAMYFNTSVNALKVYDLGNTTWLIIPQIYLSGLLDVTLTSITTGDLLTWNGSKWVNTRTPNVNSIKLNGGTGTNGTATWNNTEHTYDIVLNPNVTLQVGQEDLVYCKNNSVSVIANGRPVMASGTNGNSGNILVDLHDGTKANARRIVGITTEDLTANGYGFVTRNGKVRGINTTGSQYGETWIDGDILYVKATGNLTKVEPADTELKMPIAFVIHAHTNGTLYIRTTGIDENHDKDLISTKLDASEYTATDILTKLKTVDGSGSGVDADLLDGQEGAYYLNAGNINTGTINDSYLPDTITSDITGNAGTVTNGVYTTGDQTITGIKTFSSSPIVPTPTAGTQAVNKDYVDSKPTLPIGAILNAYTIFDNCIVAFGGEFNRADYPRLWAYLQANPSLVKTQAQWQTEATANGGICGYFSAGNGATTFRVPNLDKAFLRPDSRAVASYQDDAIRNISGTFNGNTDDGGAYFSGPFYINSTASSGANGGAGPGVIGFDASRQVPTASENRPKNIAALPLIVAK